MNCARSYENVLNFVKVMPKILLVPFFQTWCSIKSTLIIACRQLITVISPFHSGVDLHTCMRRSKELVWRTQNLPSVNVTVDVV